MGVYQFESKQQLAESLAALPGQFHAGLLFFRCGSGEIGINGEVHSVSERTVFTLHQAVDVLQLLDGEVVGMLAHFSIAERDAILIDSFSLFSPIKGAVRMALSEEVAAKVEFMLAGLEWVTNHYSPHLEMERLWLIQMLVEHLDHSLNEKMAMGEKIHPLIKKFIQRVNEQFRSCHSVDVYSREIGTSSRTLGRLMRENMGMSPKDLIAYRINTEAKRLLITTHLPIQQVAHQLGFSSSDYFNSFFRRLNRVAPLEYKQRLSTAPKMISIAPIDG